MDMTALRDEIARARDRRHEAMRRASLPAKDRDMFRDRLHALEIASTEYRTLIHAGILVTLGPLEDNDDGEVQP